jgi:methionyl-tRNA formyltransferase
LPRWRGAAPIQAAILSGDRETGVCLMAMTAGLDCGPVYASESTPIGARETAGELQERLAGLGAALLVRHLPGILAGSAEAAPQDEARATVAPKVRTADAELHWRRPAVELLRAVRAYNSAPGAWFMLGDERVKCWSARGVDGVDEPAGTVVAAGAAGIVVACGDGAVALESLQRPGRRPVTAVEFSSRQDLVGRRL